MLYYKVKSNIKVYYKTNYGLIYLYRLIKNELFTKCELNKILKDYKYYNFENLEKNIHIEKNKNMYSKNELLNIVCDKVEINKNKTAFVFVIRK